MGNELTKKYTLDEEPHASGGPSFLWRVVNGREKGKGGVKVSIFLFQKDSLKGLPRKSRDDILKVYRDGIATLNTARSPHMLRVVEVLEEVQRVLQSSVAADAYMQWAQKDTWASEQRK